MLAPPAAPPSITVPADVRGGASLAVSWAAAADPDSDLSGYTLERSVNGGGFTQIYRGGALAFTDAITKGWGTVAYRVKAYDAQSLESGYTASPARTVINNTPPAISGEDTDAGPQKGSMELAYTVTDPDPGDVLTVTESVDSVSFHSFSAVSGTAYTCAIPAETWAALADGPHILTITAADSQSGTVLRTAAFSKRSRITVTLPTSLAFSIDPNAGTLTAPDFTVENHEPYPVNLDFLGAAAAGSAARLTAPDAFPDWEKLGAADTEGSIALGLRHGADTFWFRPEGDGGTTPVLSLPVTGTETLSLTARHGVAWRKAASLQYEISYRITIA